MPSLCVLDPGLIVWDAEHFNANTHQYWDIPNYFSLFLELIEDTGNSVLISDAMHECFLESFPASQISARSSELRDFVRLVYAFIANTVPNCATYQETSAVNINPDISGRPHFPAQLAIESKGALGALNAQADCYLVSNSAVWPWHDKKIVIHSDLEVFDLPALLAEEDIALRKKLSKRIYELHLKHHINAQTATPLPAGMSDEYLQLLLDNAVWSHNGRRLCAYASAFEAYIVFHRHDGNKFHGFPVPAADLTVKGFTEFDIPRLSWKP